MKQCLWYKVAAAARHRGSWPRAYNSFTPGVLDSFPLYTHEYHLAVHKLLITHQNLRLETEELERLKGMKRWGVVGCAEWGRIGRKSLETGHYVLQQMLDLLKRRSFALLVKSRLRKNLSSRGYKFKLVWFLVQGRILVQDHRHAWNKQLPRATWLTKVFPKTFVLTNLEAADSLPCRWTILQF